MLTEQISVTLLVADARQALGVPYAIAGSLAGAVHGVMRATLVADLVADLHLEQADPLAEALGAAFCADAAMMREAIRRHSSFNLIHLDTLFKVDVFVARPREFDRAQLARRQPYLLSEDPQRWAYVASAEDTVLAKLEWYRLSGKASDRQRRDVLGLLKVQGDRLDQGYAPDGRRVGLGYRFTRRLSVARPTFPLVVWAWWQRHLSPQIDLDELAKDPIVAFLQADGFGAYWRGWRAGGLPSDKPQTRRGPRRCSLCWTSDILR